MKAVLRIFNILFCAMAALCITMFAIQPAIQFTVSYSASKDEICKVIPNQEVDIDGTKINLSDAIPEKGLKIVLDGKLTFKSLINVAQKTDSEAYLALKDEFLEPIVDRLINSDEINNFVDSAAEFVAKEAAKSVLKSEMTKNFVPEGQSDSYLSEHGVTDEYIATKIDDLYESFLPSDGTPATVDTASQALVEALNETLTVMKESDPSNPEIAAMAEVSVEDIKEPLEKMLNDYNLLNEDGTIMDTETALAVLLDKYVLNPESSSSGETPSESLPIKKMADTGEQKKKVGDVVKELVWKFVGEALEPQSKTISVVSKVVLAVIVFFMVLWGGILIVSLLKIFSKNKPYIYTGPFFWIFMLVVSIVQLVLGGIPLLLNFLLPTFKSILPGDIVTFISSLNMELKTSFIISFICGCLLLVLSIVYSIIGHKVKKDYKKQKRALRAQKEA